jgi:aspartate aminotransferase-like enzyme
METHLNKDSTPATPAISLIYALDMQLDRIINEGLENRFSRHSAMAGQVQDWVLANGFEIFAQEGYRSQTVTTISNTLSLDIAELNTFLMSKGMQIADGYGKLRGSTFRIAHMGETRIEDINNLLTALDEFIA